VNVVLVGYRGTGKSVVARALAARLGLSPFGVDARIVERAGKAIPDIVRERGWPAFRDLEEEACREAAAGNGLVIDCGGGVVEREANFAVLKGAGPVFWLTAETATIVARIQCESHRPSLTLHKSFTDEVAEVLGRRIPLYRRIADREIPTDGRTVTAITDDIAALLQQR
jgi:shikimate kinase